MHARTAEVVVPALVLTAILGVWEGLGRLLEIPAYVLPVPSNIASAITQPNASVGIYAATTLLESGLGFVIGSLGGFILGICVSEWRLVRLALLPYIIGSNAVPVVAIAPLVLIWFGYGIVSKAMVSAFLCFFPLCVNTYRGMQSADAQLRELFEIYGATPIQYMTKARLPFAVPYLFSGAKLNATYAVIGAIVGEFIGASSGLGYGMIQSLYNTDGPRLWAYLVVAIGMGVFFYGIVWLVELWYEVRYER